MVVPATKDSAKHPNSLKRETGEWCGFSFATKAAGLLPGKPGLSQCTIATRIRMRLVDHY